MKRELVYMDARSSKFWRIELDGSSHTVTYGRIGSDGQTSTKTFPTEAAARKDAEKLVKEKIGKGYVDASDAGDGAGAPVPAGGPMPFIAFTGISHESELSQNAGTFAGLRVVDFDPEKPVKSGVAYRFRSDWEENRLFEYLENYLASDPAREAHAIVIGAWHGDDSELTSEAVVQFLTENKEKLPSLSAIYVGDIVSEENEISWIKQSDLSPLLSAFPQLQLLRARGGDGLALKTPVHAALRALTLETGGMDVSVVRSICMSEFPSLEYLELWLGTENYGGNSTVRDLQPILSGRLFPKLKYLGLRNAEHANEIAAVVVNSPIVERIETLDLSLGVLTDEAGEALLKTPTGGALKRLNLHHNYFSDGMLRKLKALPINVDVSRGDKMNEESEWQFVAVGE